jgi:hypothetical protein
VVHTDDFDQDPAIGRLDPVHLLKRIETLEAAGGGGLPAGITSDGNSGLRVAKGLRVGDTAATDQADFLWVRGATELDDVDANYVDGDTVLAVNQIRPVPLGALPVPAFQVVRNGDISASDYGAPTVRIRDQSASTRSVVRVEKQGTVILELTTRKSITGALASVTDASAKAVLTSIIAALTGIAVADDNTT